MYDELGPLTVRQVGITNRYTVPPVTVMRRAPVTRAPVTRAPVTRVAATKAPRLEGDEKRDILDTVIAKAEDLRVSTIGACPVTTVEDAWNKLTDFVIDLTPPIPLLPAEVALR